MSLPNPELHEEADCKEDSNGRIDAHGQISKVPTDERGYDIIKTSRRKAPMEKVER